MSKQKDREEFVAIMAREGVPVDVARKLMRASASLTRIAELQCSSEAADRDRIPCPGFLNGETRGCPCDDYGSIYRGAGQITHGPVPRVNVQERRIELRLSAICAKYNLGRSEGRRGQTQGAQRQNERLGPDWHMCAMTGRLRISVAEEHICSWYCQGGKAHHGYLRGQHGPYKVAVIVPASPNYSTPAEVTARCYEAGGYTPVLRGAGYQMVHVGQWWRPKDQSFAKLYRAFRARVAAICESDEQAS